MDTRKAFNYRPGHVFGSFSATLGLGLSLVLSSGPASEAAAEAPTAPEKVEAEAEPEAPVVPDVAAEVGAHVPSWQGACLGRNNNLVRSGCTRSPRARAWFAFSGVVAAGTGTVLTLLVGTALNAGDPGAMMLGMGGVAIGGAALGAISGAHNGDRPAPPDRIRPSTISIDGTMGDAPVLGESAPGTTNFRIAPTWYFPNGDGRLRLLGRVGGMLGPRIDVDPRAEELEGFDTALSERSWAIDAAVDLAVALPYPVLPRFRTLNPETLPQKGFLGAWELRYKPSISIRRERYAPAGEVEERQLERIMLLPLTVGARSHLSPRQRFTFYAGPRIDYVSYRVGDGPLNRGPASIGSFYGEAWWDMDFPHLLRGKAALTHALRGQFSAGYVHTRFDGLGVNAGTAIGFMGPYNFAWRMRLQKLERPYAWQFGVGAWVGNGLGGFAEVGVSLPDFGDAPGGGIKRKHK